MISFARSALVAFLFASGSAAARAEAPIIPLQPHPTQPEWTKVCAKPGDKKNCYVTRDFVSPDGKPVLAIGYYQLRKPSERIIGRILLPLGLSLPGGVRLAIDDGAPIPGQFSTCIPTGCFAEFALTPEVAERFQKGDVLRIAARNQYLAEIGFAAPLTGFAAALKGAAVTDQELRTRQDNLSRHMRNTAASR